MMKNQEPLGRSVFLPHTYSIFYASILTSTFVPLFCTSIPMFNQNLSIYSILPHFILNTLVNFPLSSDVNIFLYERILRRPKCKRDMWRYSASFVNYDFKCIITNVDYLLSFVIHLIATLESSNSMFKLFSLIWFFCDMYCQLSSFTLKQARIHGRTLIFLSPECLLRPVICSSQLRISFNKKLEHYNYLTFSLSLRRRLGRTPLIHDPYPTTTPMTFRQSHSLYLTLHHNLPHLYSLQPTYETSFFTRSLLLLIFPSSNLLPTKIFSCLGCNTLLRPDSDTLVLAALNLLILFLFLLWYES